MVPSLGTADTADTASLTKSRYTRAVGTSLTLEHVLKKWSISI